MGLKFLARDGHSVAFASGNAFGQLTRFVGRSFKPGVTPGVAGAFAADAEPVEIAADGPDAEHFIRKAQKGALWPADAETAAACGVEFTALTRDTDGEWIAAPKSTPALARSQKSESKTES